MPKILPDTAEGIGSLVSAYLSALRRENIQSIVEKHGMEDIQPDEWYSMNTTLKLYHELADMFDKVAWGMEIGRMIASGIDSSFEDHVENINNVYHSVHRGDGIGDVIGRMEEPGYATITDCNPYPDDLEYGEFYGMAKQLLPPYTHFTIAYDEETTRRDDGGECTIYHIRWG